MKKPFLLLKYLANHNGSFSRAKKLILLAKNSGADAVKLQTYTADTMTLRSKKDILKLKEVFGTNISICGIYTTKQKHLCLGIKNYSLMQKIGIPIFSTPFDKTAVEFLTKLKCPIFKIASFEMNDLPLIKEVAKTKAYNYINWNGNS